MKAAQDKELIVSLREKLNDADYSYWTLNVPTLTDDVYDSTLNQLKNLEDHYPDMADANSPSVRVGTSESSTFEKAKHTRKMLSLDNVFSSGDVEKFFDKDTEIAIELKIDGLSVSIRYEDGVLVKALTRGDGSIGDDVTANVRTVKGVPLTLREKVTVEIRGEVYMSNSVFELLNKERSKDGQAFANPRNAAAGTLKLKDSREVASRKLSFVAYSVGSDVPDKIITHDSLLEWMEGLGFTSTYTLPATASCSGKGVYVINSTSSMISRVVKALSEYRKFLDVMTDGLVAKVNDLATQSDKGEGNKAPKWAVAYKFAAEKKSTIIKSISITIGKTGKLTPVATVSKVEIGGTMVSKASLCNQDEIERLGINVGDVVLMEKSAEIIPKVCELVTKKSEGVWKYPDKCPSCEGDITRQKGYVNHYCLNPDCAEAFENRLIHVVSKAALDMKSVGGQLVKKLIELGCRSLSDVLSFSQFNKLQRAQASNLEKAIGKAKDASFWRKLAALSIEGCGKNICQDLAATHSSILSILADAEEGKLQPTIGDVKQRAIIDWMEINEDEVLKLYEVGFSIESAEEDQGKLSGKTFVITGSLATGSRDVVEATIMENGGRVKTAVSKKVDYLVIGLVPGNNKVTAATRNGTTIISEEELFSMMDVKMPSVIEMAGAVKPQREF